MAKRAHGEGSVRQRPNGHGKPRLSYPDPETGRIQSISLYDKTAEAVRAKLDEARERIKANAPAQDSPQRLSEWLTHWSATSLEASSRKLAIKRCTATFPASISSPRRWAQCGSTGCESLTLRI